jgi:uncharacterized protein (DUF1501 family)
MALAPSRRRLLFGSGALFAWTFIPRLAHADRRDPRLLVIVLRGALDGLAVAAPVGDPDWVALRGKDALTLDGKSPALPLDSFFALNPAMPNLHRLYRAKQALIVHAVATPYRDRSHFDGQDVLESGLDHPGDTRSGWLNRALSSLTPAERAGGLDKALAAGPVAPLVVRGPAPIMSWVPPRVLPASDDTTQRLLDLYRHTDADLARVFEGRLALSMLSRSGGADTMAPPPGTALQTPAGLAQLRAYFSEAAGAAGRYLARQDGPRLGALALDGWDTHINEGTSGGYLANLLGALDGALAAVETSLGEAWRDTVVAVVTEFGRTARLNGTAGTDHGTATVALLAGGALAGGRVIADWPGVGDAALYEDRDLRATSDLRAVLKGLLRDHLQIDEAVLAADIFPDSAAVAPVPGLIA